MSNHDVEKFINGLVDFLGTIFGAIQAALHMLPPVVLGFILIIAGIFWLIRKARHG